MVYFGLIIPVFAFIVTAIAWLLRNFEPGLPRWLVADDALDALDDGTGMAEWFATYVWPLAQQREGNVILRYVAIAIVIAAIILLLIKLYGKTEKTQYDKVKSEVRETRVSIAAPREHRKKHRARNNQVREIYRKFLRRCRKGGINVTPSMTSLDIEHLASKRFSCPQSQELREMYIQARYNNVEFDKQDLTKARDLYKKISAKIAANSKADLT
jgi:hypothetical protein